MGNAQRSRARSARERVAVQRAAARRAERRRRVLIAGGGISLVAILAIVLVVVRPGPATNGQPLLTSDGKPEILYMGGEYCPFCAAERWALTAALGRFGTFTGLSLIHSSPADVYASTPTLSFHQSGYTSKYVSFTPVEWFGEASDPTTPFGHAYLDQPTAPQAALFSKYAGGSIPFVDIANQYLLPQAQYMPSALQGMSWSPVATAMQDPASPVARDIDGAANMITAAICKLTNGQPGGVCSSAGVTAAAGSLRQ